MSHEATNWAFKPRGMSAATKMVLLMLADRHNPDLGCFPSKKRLAEDCEMSLRSVFNHIKTLEGLGLVHVIEGGKRGNGGFSSNRYVLGFEDDFPAQAKFADSNSCRRTQAKFAGSCRQNLPNNPVREPCKNNPVSIYEKREASSPKSKATTKRVDPVQQAFDAYNEEAEQAGWLRASSLDADRKKSIRARLKECGGIDGWRQALERASTSPYLKGQTPHGFRMHLDFLVDKVNFRQLREGVHDRRTGQTPTTSYPHAGSGHSSLILGFASYADRQSDRQGAGYREVGDEPIDITPDSSDDRIHDGRKQ